MGKFRFGKEEKLNKKKFIEELFETGSSFSAFPLKVIHIPKPAGGRNVHQVLITVPTKNFPKAVDRNTIKRRIREGYRLNKTLFQVSSPLCIAYIYIAKEVLTTPIIHKAIQTTLERLSRYETKN